MGPQKVEGAARGSRPLPSSLVATGEGTLSALLPAQMRIFVRVHNVNLGHFTIDRLVTILGRLGQEVEFSFTVHPRTRRAEPDPANP